MNALKHKSPIGKKRKNALDYSPIGSYPSYNSNYSPGNSSLSTHSDNDKVSLARIQADRKQDLNKLFEYGRMSPMEDFTHGASTDTTDVINSDDQTGSDISYEESRFDDDIGSNISFETPAGNSESDLSYDSFPYLTAHTISRSNSDDDSPNRKLIGHEHIEESFLSARTNSNDNLSHQNSQPPTDSSDQIALCSLVIFYCTTYLFIFDEGNSFKFLSIKFTGFAISCFFWRIITKNKNLKHSPLRNFGILVVYITIWNELCGILENMERQMRTLLRFAPDKNIEIASRKKLICDHDAFLQDVIYSGYIDSTDLYTRSLSKHDVLSWNTSLNNDMPLDWMSVKNLGKEHTWVTTLNYGIPIGWNSVQQLGKEHTWCESLNDAIPTSWMSVEAVGKGHTWSTNIKNNVIPTGWMSVEVFTEELRSDFPLKNEEKERFAKPSQHMKNIQLLNEYQFEKLKHELLTQRLLNQLLYMESRKFQEALRVEVFARFATYEHTIVDYSQDLPTSILHSKFLQFLDRRITKLLQILRSFVLNITRQMEKRRKNAQFIFMLLRKID